jgi:purine-binding chemotaxis protein CheW
MENQLVVFELANEFYGINIDIVESIIKMQAITQLPHTPAYVKGVTNLRGIVLPVIDLRTRFNLPENDASKDSRIIVVSLNNVKVGMLVDAVSEVQTVPADSIEPPPPMVATVDASFITGIAKVDQHLVSLLDLQRVLLASEHALGGTGK